MADMGITDFLAARWDELEAAAKAAGYGAAGDYLWQEIDPDRMPGLIGTGCGDVVTFNQGTPAYAVSPSRGQATHIALNDPAAVLADIEAKRKILAAMTALKHVYIEGDSWYSCSQAVDPYEPGEGPGSGCLDENRAGNPCDCGRDRLVAAVLGALAVPFASHPGYDPSWRPEQ
jgi:Family of unknown function (DUF6221)